MTHLIKLWLGAACLLLSGCGSSSAAPKVEQQIDGLFAAYDKAKRPGYAIGIMRDGELIFAKGYGHADLAQDEPITADTSFNLASLSKQLTAAAVALEIEAGRIDPDERLAKYWPGLPDFMADITVAHLIYMTSGLKEYYTLPAPHGSWQSEDGFTVDEAIRAVFNSGELDFVPGTRWSYSNINYQLLAKVTAQLNDRDFATHMDAVLFAPLGMDDSWVDVPIDTSRLNKALSYVWDDETGGWRHAPRLSPHYGGSGVHASLHDLAKWDRALYHTDILGAGFRDRMLSTRNFEHDKTNDAFGLVHGSYQGLKTIWYEGGDYGVSTYMVRLPERQETVICLSNFGHGRCAEKVRAIIDLLVSFEP